MEITEHGTIHGGHVVLSSPVSLPDGTEVVVHIEPTDQGAISDADPATFDSLPVFGIWADREDMQDAVDWVDRERAQWRCRLNRQ